MEQSPARRADEDTLSKGLAVLSRASARFRVDVRGWREAAAPTIAAVIAIAVLSGCGAVSRASPAVSGPAAVASVQGGAPAHVEVIVMENEEYGSVVSAGSAPYIASYIRPGPTSGFSASARRRRSKTPRQRSVGCSRAAIPTRTCSG